MTALLWISATVAIWVVLMVGLFALVDRLHQLRVEGTRALAELISMLDRHDRMAGEHARTVAARFNPRLRDLENTSPYKGPERRGLADHHHDNVGIFNGTAFDDRSKPC